MLLRRRPFHALGVVLCCLTLVLSACTTKPTGAPPAPPPSPAPATQPSPPAAAPAAPAAPAPKQAPAAPAVLKVALGSMVAMLDPNAKTSGPPATIVFYPVFDALTFIDDKGKVQPGLATAWKAVNDTTWEFELRKGVKFSDGKDFTAADVKFTYDRVLNPNNKQVVRARIETVKSAEVIDSHKVRLVTTNPDPILPQRVAVAFILPKDYFTAVGEQKFAEQPVGTGAFKFKSFVPSSSAVLEAVPTSWRGKPKVDVIELRSMTEAATRVAALKAGEVHLAQSIPPDQAKQLANQQGLKIVSATLGQTNVIVLNALLNTPLKNKKVRQALNYAVDKQAIVNTIMQGYGEPAGQLVADNGVGHDPGIKPYPYDPAKAKQLLAEAGFANGFEMTVHSTQGLQLNDKEMTEAVVGFLNAVGVKAKLQVIEYAAFVQAYHNGGMDPAFFIGWWYFPAMDGDFVYVWNQTKMKQARINNSQFDQLYAAATAEMNPDKRLKTMQEMARLFHDEAPVIFLMHPAQTYGVQATVQGFTPRADSVIWFDTISLSK